MSRRIVVSLGSNLGDRKAYLAQAKAALLSFPSTRWVDESEIEETDPVDVPEEFSHLKFLNQIIRFDTDLDAVEFSTLMHRVEDGLGRVRTIVNGPRTIDIDLIDFDGLCLSSPSLTLPHPRANERDFVREPWKKLIRTEMKHLRAIVSAQSRQLSSIKLCTELAKFIEGAKVVAAYEALKTELDLTYFITACRQKNIEIIFPQKTENGYEMSKAEFADVWIVPGLAFTAKGERLGFGGGWYDRFLAKAKASALTIGVGYSFQLVRALPQSLQDQKLKRILTI